LRCNISETLHDTELMSTDDNLPSSMLYRLARSALTQRDLEKSKIALIASYGWPSLPELSSCYCALHFPIVEAPRKSGGGQWGRLSCPIRPTSQWL